MNCNIFILICLISNLCYAQHEIENTKDYSRLAEDLIGFQDLDADYEQVYENLMQLLSNPVDLNSVTADELRMLHMLTGQQINEFLNYREEQGALKSIYELQAIPSFDLETILRFRQVVTVREKIAGDGSLLSKITGENNSYFITRMERTLEKKKGFINDEPEKKFIGSEDKLYLRYRSSLPNDYSMGFTAEKDAGEMIDWRPKQNQYGFDFLSYHFQLKNRGKIKNIIAGDFQCQFGQGLILGGAFGLGKGAETITTTRRNNVGLLPYTSAVESGYYRGGGVTLQLARNLFFTGFYSSTKIDATLQSDSSQQSISAFQSTGFHRNQKELESRKQITEEVYATVLNYKNRTLDAGVIFQKVNFDTPINKKPNLYNQFAFHGSTSLTVGSFFSYTNNNFNWFGEAAQSLRAGRGLIMGMLTALHQNLDMAIVFRKYDRDFNPFYANAFSENSLPQNETGIYWGWKYSWKRKFTLSGYTDLFRFPWLGFRRYAPGNGYEWLARLSYQPSRKVVLFVQTREESKPRNISSEASLYHIDYTTKRNYWFAANYSASDKLSLKTRVQLNTFSFSGSQTDGITILQDISYSVGKFQISARHALFDAEEFENRNYVYENDAWMAFSLPAYYGVGIRNYVLVEYKISKRFTIWLRYARTKYTDRNIIGSGEDSIYGNSKNDLKFQTLLRF